MCVSIDSYRRLNKCWELSKRLHYTNKYSTLILKLALVYCTECIVTVGCKRCLILIDVICSLKNIITQPYMRHCISHWNCKVMHCMQLCIHMIWESPSVGGNLNTLQMQVHKKECQLPLFWWCFTCMNLKLEHGEVRNFWKYNKNYQSN